MANYVVDNYVTEAYTADDVYVDWGTKIIFIPQNFLTFIGGQVYTLDTDALRLKLKDLEDSPAGIAHLKTHNHNTEISLGGVLYSRIIEITSGYTITFEETVPAYVVNIVGSNNNVLDVTNLNTTQVRSNNSAGLINIRELQHDIYGGVITIDVINGQSGTIYPAGTPLQPVNNIPDAVVLAEIRGISTFQVIGDLTLDAGDDISNIVLLGQNATRSTITINSAADTLGCEIQEAFVTGNLDGDTILRNCVIQDLDYINGFVYNCMINPGTISLGGSDTAHFLNCYSSVPGMGTPTIDMNGPSDNQNTPLAIRNYNGGIKLIQKNGAADASIDLASGQVIIDSSCSSGKIVVRGDGKVIDENGNHLLSGVQNGGLVLHNECNYGDHVHDIWKSLGLNPDDAGAGSVIDAINVLDGKVDNLPSAVDIANTVLDGQGLSDIATAVWAHTSRTLTGNVTVDLNTLAAAVWAETTRTLTDDVGVSPQDISDIATAVWAEATRTLTDDVGVSAQNISDIADAVWVATTRTLTAGGSITAQDITDITESVWSYSR